MTSSGVRKDGKEKQGSRRGVVQAQPGRQLVQTMRKGALVGRAGKIHNKSHTFIFKLCAMGLHCRVNQ